MCGMYDNSLLIQYLIQPELYLSNPFPNQSEELRFILEMSWSAHQLRLYGMLLQEFT